MLPVHALSVKEQVVERQAEQFASLGERPVAADFVQPIGIQVRHVDSSAFAADLRRDTAPTMREPSFMASSWRGEYFDPPLPLSTARGHSG